MRFKTFGLVIAALILSKAAFAGMPLKVWYQDFKMPTQYLLEHDLITNPALGSGLTILNAGTAATSAATTFSTFAAQPDVPRNVVLTPGGTTANVGAGTAVVSGTNI